MSADPTFYLEITKKEILELRNLLEDFIPELINSGKEVPDELIQTRIKVENLYKDNCVEYFLSPMCKAYIEKYGETPAWDRERWEAFKTNYGMLVELGFLSEEEDG
jgi:hypothetical protein